MSATLTPSPTIAGRPRRGHCRQPGHGPPTSGPTATATDATAR